MKKIKSIILLLAFSSMLLASYQQSYTFGKKMFDDGLYEEATRELSYVIKQAPTSPEAEQAIFYTAKSYFNLKNYAKAEEFYNKLYTGYPGSNKLEESLLQIGICQKLQGSYAKAITNFEELIKKYPLNKHTYNSLLPYIETLFLNNEFDKLLEKVSSIEKNYPKVNTLADILLVKARVLNKQNKKLEFNQILKQIEEKYSKAEVKWFAFELRITNEKDFLKASKELEQELKKEVPRFYQKKLSLLLSNLYQKTNQSTKAIAVLKQLIQKFNQDPDLDEYIISYFTLLEQTANYSEIDNSDFDLVFKKSNLKPDYVIFKAKAKVKLNMLDKAKQLLTNAKFTTENAKNQKQLLEAEIMFLNGNYQNSVNAFENLKNSKYVNQAEINFKIADIFYSKLNNSSKAIAYFQIAAGLAKNNNLKAKAALKLAYCFESKQNYKQALVELNSINLNSVDDETLKQSIKNKIDLIQKYKLPDYATATANLAMLLYKKEEQNISIANDLIDVLIYDLKNFDQALEMLEKSNNANANYKKALVYLALAEKAKLTTSTKLSFYKQKINETITKLASQAQFKQEIEIRQQLLFSKIDENLINKINSYVLAYEGSNTAGLFKLKAANWYLQNNQADKSFALLKNLEYNKLMQVTEFENAMLALAEYYYSQQNYNQALLAYDKANNLLTIARAENIHHKALSMYNTNNKEQALQLMQFLFKNAENYEKKAELGIWLADRFRLKQNHKQALNIWLSLPDNQKNDDYYRNLSEDYLNLKQQKKAKNALLKVIDKTNDDLTRLAGLLFETKDYKLALYTYEKVYKQTKTQNSLFMQGHILFIEESFKKASAKLSKLLKIKKLDSKIKAIAAKELTISYYKQKNRPKAEKTFKSYKKLLKADNSALFEIDFAKAMYWQNTDLKKAQNIFEDISEEDNYTTEQKQKARLWYAIMLMQRKKNDDALAEFTKLKNSKQKQISLEAMLKLGSIYFTKEEFNKAMQYYMAVINEDDTGKLAPTAAENYAILCKRIEQWEKAIKAYELLQARWADSKLKAETGFNIAYCYYRDAKYYKAIEMFEKAIIDLKNEELKAEAQYWIGEAYFSIDNFEQAVSEFLKVGYAYPNQARWVQVAKLKAGEAYVKLGKTDKAKYIFEKIISQYGKKSDIGSEASIRLKALQ